MRRRALLLAFLGTLIPAGALAQEGAPASESVEGFATGRLRERSRWYLSIALGAGGGELREASGATGFDPPLTNVPIPWVVAVQAGLPIGRRLLVGVEWSFLYAIHTTESRGPSSPGIQDRDLRVAQWLATATFFPLEPGALEPGERERAPRRWFVRGGAGWAFFQSEPTESWDDRWTGDGVGVSAGTGWSWWVGRSRTRTLTVAGDVTWQEYGAGSSPAESALLAAFTVGLQFH